MSAPFTSIRCNLVAVSKDRVRVVLSLIPDGCLVSAIDPASLPTDGTPTVDGDSGMMFCVWEIDLADGLGAILNAARRDLDLAFFARQEPPIQASRIRAALAFALASLFLLARGSR